MVKIQKKIAIHIPMFFDLIKSFSEEYYYRYKYKKRKILIINLLGFSFGLSGVFGGGLYSSPSSFFFQRSFVTVNCLLASYKTRRQ